MNLVPQQGPTRIRRHRTKFCTRATWRPRFVEFGGKEWTDFTRKLL